MKKVIAILAVATLVGCAGLQTKLANAKSKTKDAWPKIECRAAAVEPYIDFILESDLPAVLDGFADIDFILDVAGVVKEEKAAVVSAFAACGKL